MHTPETCFTLENQFTEKGCVVTNKDRLDQQIRRDIGDNYAPLVLRPRIQSSFIGENTRDPLKKWLSNSDS